jgi:indolepyruvate ferredoxin oxidoreductase alpha subunit
MKKLLSGNEAIARGAYEYGVKVAAGYPGTPSTEILENLSQYEGVYVEWAPNEKVALEVAIGASLTGIRAMATMKHVGLNVAADPLMTVSYTGVEGGLVIVVADDPGMHSSQNEQDSRNYARFAKVPLLEPSDSDEAKRFLGLAFEISEQYDTPVIVRSTTRISQLPETTLQVSDGSFLCEKQEDRSRRAEQKIARARKHLS